MSEIARELAALEELRLISERLLLAGLREHERLAEARRVAELLEDEALHDPLTGLPNRALLNDRLEQAIHVARREHTTFAICFLDLDRFKTVNDRFGHQVGDQLLRAVADRLRGALREADTVARLHGDEFAVLLPGADEGSATVLVRRLAEALAAPHILIGQTELIEASIGIALYPTHGQDADTLLRQADMAMYRAKRTKNRYTVAEEGLYNHDDNHPVEAADPRDFPAVELQEVNERLLLVSLRQHDLATQLAQQLAFTGSITDSLGEGILALERTGRITFANPAAARLLDWAAADLVGQDIRALLPAPATHEAAQTLEDPLLAALHAGLAAHGEEALFARRDGTTLCIEYTASPLSTTNQSIGMVVAFRDITARQRTTDERALVLAQVNAALAFRTRFLAITAHELKTPLTIIDGYAQQLRRRVRPTDDPRLLVGLEAIEHQAHRMTQLIDDLIDVAHLATEGFVLDRSRINLNLLLAETIEEVRIVAPTFSLYVDHQAQEIHVSGDRLRLQQVLLNLLLNAVKYSTVRLEVVASIRQDSEWAIIAVTDYGQGIPVEQQAAVFDPYFRAANVAAGTSGGQGLGLFISKAIVDRHAGRLELVSTEGAGSTFTLALPLAPAEAPSPSHHHPNPSIGPLSA